MKFFALFALCFVAGRVLAGDEAALAAVRAADDERVAATIASDAARLEAIYSPDLYYAHSSGKVDNQAAHLAGLAKRTTAYEKFDYLTRDFRLVAPGLVLMTGRVVIRSTTPQGPVANDVNFLAAWRLEKGAWRFLAWQATKNPPPDSTKK
jgi:hypothetical protein